MAGLGRKIFNSGDILLASEVQGFLQDQSVMVFDDSATRATAIGTANFSEGMVTYTKDDDAIQVFDGTSFVPVGSEPGLVHIETADLATKSAQSFNNVFTSDFRHYKIIFECVHSTSASTTLRLRVAGADNSTANYVNVGGSATSGAVTGFRLASQTQFGISGTAGSSQADITFFKPNLATGTTGLHLCMDGDGVIRMVGSNFTLSTAFDGFTLGISTGTFTSGQISVYGIKD